MDRLFIIRYKLFKLFRSNNGIVIDGIETSGPKIEHILNLINISRLSVSIKLNIGQLLFEQL